MSWKWWRISVAEKSGDAAKKLSLLLESVDEAIVGLLKEADSLDVYISAPRRPYAAPPLVLEKLEPDLSAMDYAAYGVFARNANMSTALGILSGLKRSAAVFVHYILSDKKSYYEVYVFAETERTISIVRSKVLKSKKVPPKKIFDALRKKSIIGKGEKIEKDKLLNMLVFNPKELSNIAKTLPPYVPWITYEEFVKLITRKREHKK